MNTQATSVNTEEEMALKNADLEKLRGELRTEASLESVRVQTMSTQKSEEIASILADMFKGIAQLDMTLVRVIFWIFNPDKDSFNWWSANYEIGNTASYFEVPFKEYHVFQTYFKAWQKKTPVFLYDFEGELQESWQDILFNETAMGKLPIELKNGMRDEWQICTVSAISEYGLVMLGCIELLSKENIDVIQHFEKTFQQSFTRYRDVQKAEAQAIETQIEAALEKVRSRSLAVQKRNELNKVVFILFEKIKELQIPATAVGIGIYIDGSKDLNTFVCDENEEGLVFTNYRLPYFNNKIARDACSMSEKQLDFFVGYYSKGEKNIFYQYLIDHIAEFRHLPEDIKRTMFESPSYTITMMAVKNAVFTINDFEGKVLGKNKINIIKRFAKVFDQTYTRFLDLEKSEEQAKQVIKQASLDSVRGEIASMRSTTDLDRITPLFSNELTTLGVPFIRCGVSIIHEEFKNIEIFLSNPDGLALTKMDLAFGSS
ncbi:MAG: hypothetical protein ACI9K1_002400 [Arcticibacterium sp.]|jgi:hypothetical protein